MTVPEPKRRRSAHLVTYGCQMNDAASNDIREMLLTQGFDIVATESEADLIILNTCTIRRKAEDTVFHRLDHVKGFKRINPGLVVGVVGCMGASSRDELEQRTPYVDFILPPHQVDAIRDIVQMRFPGDLDGETGADLDPSETPYRGLVNISRGCNNNCTFCIVPSVRGRETCFSPEEIERQVRRLVEGGALEITFLGQNVNSYRSGEVDFADLVSAICPRFPQIGFRFTSPHPKDFSNKFILAMARVENLLRQVHLPMQSGSDRVLRLMKRSYNMKRFYSRVDRLRQHMPGIALGTDVICGFPGETEDDFEQTLEAVRRIRFDSAYMFFYSPRPGTEAVNLPGHLPEELRKDRLNRLISVQLEISREKNLELVGQVHRGLVERPARRPPGYLQARLDCNRLVIFPGSENLLGSQLDFEITSASQVALFGRPRSVEGAAAPS